MSNGRMTPKQMAHALDLIEKIKPIMNAIEQKATEMLHQGIDIPGYEADWTSPRRKWENEEQANELLADLGLEKKERYSVELISPTAAEKLLKSKGKWPKKKRGSAEEDFVNPLVNVIGHGEKKPTFCKVKDN